LYFESAVLINIGVELGIPFESIELYVSTRSLFLVDLKRIKKA
jgi:hypothetical protein